ncbi:MAG: DUF4097 family beta strand repeat-containing protein [Christensenellales bacterium]
MKRILIIVATIVAIACVGLMSGCQVSSAVRCREYSDADNYLAGNRQYEGELHSVVVNWCVGEVNLTQSQDGTITVTEENDLEESQKVRSYFADGVLRVEFWQSGLASKVNSKDKKVTISCPKTYDIEVICTSAKVTADTLDADNVKIVMTSGYCSIGEINAKTFDFISTSGSIVVNKMNCTIADIGSTSGGCELNEVQVETLNFTSTSGSAYAEIDGAKLVKFGSTSGSVNLKLNVDATISFSTTSGSFSCEKEHIDSHGKKIIGSGETIIDVTTTSGSLRVR